jgi:transposase
VLGLVAALSPIAEQISQLTSQIAGAVRCHPDGEIFLGLFRDAKRVICAAGLLAEIGDDRARYPTRDSLAADAGQAPVTIQSGKRSASSFRWARDKQLASVVAITPTRSAYSAGRGHTCSGAAGNSAPLTTTPDTTRCSEFSPPKVDT